LHYLCSWRLSVCCYSIFTILFQQRAPPFFKSACTPDLFITPAFISRAIQKAVDDWHRQQALKRILDFKPYKIDQDSVEILREVREGRIQQVLQASQQ
jgi:hypothetical protein